MKRKEDYGPADYAANGMALGVLFVLLLLLVMWIGQSLGLMGPI